MLLGCIADDFTGATDLANTLVGQGMRTIQTIGVPNGTFDCPDADALVVALKSRTIPAEDAVLTSLEALDWLRTQGARQIFFKYCSTFDSTDHGNIGPVADALSDALEVGFTIACPAVPANGRRVFQGHHFVGERLLSEASMRDHPLTPMRDSDLVRVLGRQTARRVGLVSQQTVASGTGVIRSRFRELRESGYAYAIVDAISDSDLLAIGHACDDLALVTGGSEMALGMPENFRRRGLLGTAVGAGLPGVSGKRAVLAGSCPEATRAQLALAKRSWPSFVIDPLAVASGRDVAAMAIDWVNAQVEETPILVYSSTDPQEIAGVQQGFGRVRIGHLIEETHARIAASLVEAGVRQLVVAGGETSGVAVQALQVPALRIGPEIDPGVPLDRVPGRAASGAGAQVGKLRRRRLFH